MLLIWEQYSSLLRRSKNDNGKIMSLHLRSQTQKLNSAKNGQVETAVAPPSLNKYQGLFEATPISLWEEDFSQIKQFIDQLRQNGVTDFSDSLYTLNETGTRIWQSIEKKQPLEAICRELSQEYNADRDKITQGVLNLVETLLSKGIIQEWKS